MENNLAPATAKLIKDLKAALHRRESYFVPLARFVLFWLAFICVIVDIAHERKGRKEGQSRWPSFCGWTRSGSSVRP